MSGHPPRHHQPRTRTERVEFINDTLGYINLSPAPVCIQVSPLDICFSGKPLAPGEKYFIYSLKYTGFTEDDVLRVPSGEELFRLCGENVDLKKVRVIWGEKCSPEALLKISESPKFKEVFIVSHVNSDGVNHLLQLLGTRF